MLLVGINYDLKTRKHECKILEFKNEKQVICHGGSKRLRLALVYRFHTSHVFTIHFQAVCSTEHACRTGLCIGMILKHIIPGGYRKLRNYTDCLFPP